MKRVLTTQRPKDTDRQARSSGSVKRVKEAGQTRFQLETRPLDRTGCRQTKQENICLGIQVFHSRSLSRC
uniref:Uncharacterized protein n=1 Tax=Utricularia reniformis TaxID=192314 RepID=A0A1Y0AZW6_9LAMI|nr:hypothetical protein AEK19_MT0427 [Utricularia reniformis]ART30690.1 hypothetical protein AEK19_MT0427 [Utricularia reniformis]